MPVTSKLFEKPLQKLFTPPIGGRVAGSAARYDVALFANGETGFVYDFSLTARLRQLSGGATLVGADADPVGWAQSLDPTQRVATQATAGSRPLWKTPNFIRNDGVASNLLTTLAPSLAFTMAVKFKQAAGSAGSVLIGSRVVAASSAWMQCGASGFLAGTVGTQTLTGPVVSGVVTVGVFTWDGSFATLYRNGAAVVGPSAQTGVPNTTIPICIGAMNNNGTAGFFAAADAYNALAINRALTAAEVANLTTYWGTT